MRLWRYLLEKTILRIRLMTEKRSGTGSSHFAIASKRRLESLFLFVTGRCNSKCAHCFYAGDMAEKEKDLSFDEIKKLSETAGDFNRLWISGGEPTLREDMPEIIELFYRHNHIKDVNIPSNGMKGDLLVDWIKRWQKSCPGLNISIAVSLDGFAETHTRQRGVLSFYDALETLVKLDNNFRDDAHVVANIPTCITKFNFDEMTDFFYWVYGRLHVATHSIGAARGITREDDVKITSAEESMRKLNDAIAPFLMLYAKRMGEGVGALAKPITKIAFAGLMRSMYNAHAENLDKATCWGVDCTAGETTLVIDYDGRFRACEMREPVGKVQDYDCDVQKIMYGEAMQNEIKTIGYGYKANCWCSHSCWLVTSIGFSPLKAVSRIVGGYRQVKKLSGGIEINDAKLSALEEKYHLDRAKLKEIGVL
jgi:MoaA/NifB/PqqE/SkfB family radical SAM enzyme